MGAPYKPRKFFQTPSFTRGPQHAGKDWSIIILEWIEKLKAIEPGDAIFIPCESAAAQKAMVADFSSEVKAYMAISPEAGARLSVGKKMAEGIPYVVLRKNALSPTRGFVKTSDGTVQRISVECTIPPRVLRMMEEDSVNPEEICDSEKESENG